MVLGRFSSFSWDSFFFVLVGIRLFVGLISVA